MQNQKIYIIGAGIAGLCAAREAVKQGYSVKVIEASKHAGGRCRSYFDEALGMEVDNGNHLLLGACKATMRLIRELGTEERFNRFGDGVFNFYDTVQESFYSFTPKLADNKTFGKGAELAMLKFMLLPQTGTVEQSFKKYPELYRRLIDPVSRSILNTPSYKAAASSLKKVLLQAALWPEGFAYYYPKTGWHDALIKPLLEKLEEAGVEIEYGKALKEIKTAENKVSELVFDGEIIDVTQAKVILAVPAYMAAKLLEQEMPDEYGAIVNMHFACEHKLRPQVIGITGAPVEWIFVKPGHISTTYSAAEKNFGVAEVVATWGLCAKLLGLPSTLPAHRLLTEKRAALICTKENLKKRQRQKTKYENLVLAGDHVKTGLPGTIEGAVVSGDFRLKGK